MWQRIVLCIVAAILLINGGHMLFAPEHWYPSIASVPHTGPFNAHFVRDIGCAYLAAGLGVAIGAWRVRWLVPAALPALMFLGLHALVHAWESLFAHSAAAAHADATDFLGVYGPPVLIVIILFTARTTREA